MTKRITLSVILVTALVLIGAQKVKAADYCIEGVSSVNVTYVGKNFKVPAAGKCVDWFGFCSSGCSPDNLQTGTACTASDRSHVSFVITTAYAGGNRQWDWIRLDLPDETGNGNLKSSSDIGSIISYAAAGGTCDPKKVPVP